MSRGSRPELHKPGEVVPKTGIYKVYHHRHRLMHEAALIGGTVFPQCRKCLAEVRFALVRVAEEKLVLPFRETEFLEEYDEEKPRGTAAS